MNCTVCQGTGIQNIDQISEADLAQIETSPDFHEAFLEWLKTQKDPDAMVCTCCGDGKEWYGEPGEHHEVDYGHNGPYANNGGLPKCF